MVVDQKLSMLHEFLDVNIHSISHITSLLQLFLIFRLTKLQVKGILRCGLDLHLNHNICVNIQLLDALKSLVGVRAGLF